jgi:hypothetical protein
MNTKHKSIILAVTLALGCASVQSAEEPVSSASGNYKVVLSSIQPVEVPGKVVILLKNMASDKREGSLKELMAAVSAVQPASLPASLVAICKMYPNLGAKAAAAAAAAYPRSAAKLAQVAARVLPAQASLIAAAVAAAVPQYASSIYAALPGTQPVGIQGASTLSGSLTRKTGLSGGETLQAPPQISTEYIPTVPFVGTRTEVVATNAVPLPPGERVYSSP